MPEATSNVREIPKPREISITEDQINEINFPELSQDIFKVGDREFAIRVLPWKWEMLFRKHAMPLMEAEFKPIEKMIYSFQAELYLTDKDLGITESVFASEMQADECITKSLAIVCVSQDEIVRKKASAGEEITAVEYQALEKKYRVMLENAEGIDPSPRVYYRAVLAKQMEKQRMVQALGESVLTRLENFAGLVGTDKASISSLKVLFMQRVRSVLERAGHLAQTLVNSSGLPTEDSSATSTQNYKASLIKTKEEIERTLERIEATATPTPAAAPENPTPPPSNSEEKKIAPPLPAELTEAEPLAVSASAP
jgi:hypothetical protein